MKMNFKDLLICAKENQSFAVNQIHEMYKPILLKESVVNGIYDEDLYQEMCLSVIKCIEKIKI